jgi:hypothetical protein
VRPGAIFTSYLKGFYFTSADALVTTASLVRISRSYIIVSVGRFYRILYAFFYQTKYGKII